MSELTKYTGTLQSTREMEAARIEDEMFIFTGTYPLIYKGDGNLYLLPDYKTSFTDLENAGYNTLSSNFNEVNRYDEFSVLDAGQNDFESDEYSIRDTDFAPLIPYRLEEDNEPVKVPLDVAVSYSVPSEIINSTFNQFLPDNFVGQFESIEDANNSLSNLLGGQIIYVKDPGNLNTYSFYQLSSETQHTVDVRKINGDIFYDYNGQTYEETFFGSTIKTEFGDFLNTNVPINSISISAGVAEPGMPGPVFYEVVNSGQITQYGLDNNYALVFNDDDRIFDLQKGTNSASFQSFYMTNRNISYGIDNVETFRVEIGNVWKKKTANELGLEKLYEITLVPYTRFPTPGSAWERVPFGNYSASIHSSINPEGANLERADETQAPVSTIPSGKIGEITDPLRVYFNTISSEMKDYRFDLVVTAKGYIDSIVTGSENENFVFFTTEYQTEEVYREEFIIEDLEPTLYKLEDFPTEEEPDRGNFKLRALWSANRVIEHYGKLIAYGSLEMPETAFVSFPENYRYFPSNFTLHFNTDANEPITSIKPFTQILVVQTANRTWGLKGNSSAVFLDANAQTANPNAYRVFDINTSIGAIAPHTVKPVRNRLFFLSNEGIAALVSLYATDDRYNVKLMDRNIENIVPRDKNAVAIQHDNQYWINFPDSGKSFRYYIDKEAWTEDDFSHFKEFNGIRKFYRNEGVLRFITNKTLVEAQDNEYKMYEAVIDKSLPTDFGLNVASKMITADLDQSMPFHEKRYKELKFDFVIQNEYLPDLTPLEIDDIIVQHNAGTYEFMFTADLIKNHKYNLSFSLGLSEVDVPNDDGIKTISNIEVTVDGEPLENVGIDNEGIYFILGPSDTKRNGENIRVQFESEEDFSSEWLEAGYSLVDQTYDLDIKSYVTVSSDGNFVNREALEVIEPQEESFFNLSELDKLNLGTRFSNFTFGQTPFGDVAKTVQTVRLAGSGYGLTVSLEDESRSKWTLETLGVHYRMRKPRSR